MNREAMVASLALAGWFPVVSLAGNLGLHNSETKKGLVPVFNVGNLGKWDCHIMGVGQHRLYYEEAHWGELEDVKIQVLYNEVFREKVPQ